jgi:hypothetical protein
MLNDFCLYCVGGYKNRQEIFACSDRKCPFYRFRRYNLEYQEKRKNEYNNRYTKINKPK